MGRIAVDVVLLPEEAVRESAIELNAELVRRFGEKIVLNKGSCLPHISLAMGCIEESDIPAIEEILARIASETSLGDLSIVGISVTGNVKGEKVSCFEIERTKEVQSLHEKVMEELAIYFTSDVTEDMIYGDEEVAETTLQWIKNYAKQSSFSNFYPHITIGYGEIKDQGFVRRFCACNLALCHLGNHCTCRRIIASIGLKGR